MRNFLWVVVSNASALAATAPSPSRAAVGVQRGGTTCVRSFLPAAVIFFSKAFGGTTLHRAAHKAIQPWLRGRFVDEVAAASQARRLDTGPSLNMPLPVPQRIATFSATKPLDTQIQPGTGRRTSHTLAYSPPQREISDCGGHEMV